MVGRDLQPGISPRAEIFLHIKFSVEKLLKETEIHGEEECFT